MATYEKCPSCGELQCEVEGEYPDFYAYCDKCGFTFDARETIREYTEALNERLLLVKSDVKPHVKPNLGDDEL